MDTPITGTNQSEGHMRSVAAERDPAFDLAHSLVRRERARGSNVDDAWRSIAYRLRVGTGTFRNIVKERVKRVDGRIRDRLRALLIRELEAEITRLTHELELARQSGDHFASQHVSAIETHLAAAKALLSPPVSAQVGG